MFQNGRGRGDAGSRELNRDRHDRDVRRIPDRPARAPIISGKSSPPKDEKQSAPADSVHDDNTKDCGRSEAPDRDAAAAARKAAAPPAKGAPDKTVAKSKAGATAAAVTSVDSASSNSAPQRSDSSQANSNVSVNSSASSKTDSKLSREAANHVQTVASDSRSDRQKQKVQLEADGGSETCAKASSGTAGKQARTSSAADKNHSVTIEQNSAAKRSADVTPVKPAQTKTKQQQQQSRADASAHAAAAAAVTKSATSGGTAIDANDSVASKHSSHEEEADFGHLHRAAEDLVADVTDDADTVVSQAHASQQQQQAALHADASSAAVRLPQPTAERTAAMSSPAHVDKWFYRDPQGDVQGPFAAEEMNEWFSAGYFTMTLQVRRGGDETFCALGDLIKKWGRVPFTPGPGGGGPSLQPIKVSTTNALVAHWVVQW